MDGIEPDISEPCGYAKDLMAETRAKCAERRAVDRYTQNGSGVVKTFPGGTFVLSSDYDALLAEVEQLKAQRNELLLEADSAQCDLLLTVGGLLFGDDAPVDLARIVTEIKRLKSYDYDLVEFPIHPVPADPAAVLSDPSGVNAVAIAHGQAVEARLAVESQDRPRIVSMPTPVEYIRAGERLMKTMKDYGVSGDVAAKILSDRAAAVRAAQTKQWDDLHGRRDEVL